jgi:hypothetical protein
MVLEGTKMSGKKEGAFKNEQNHFRENHDLNICF